jgi:hypothetical protein
VRADVKVVSSFGHSSGLIERNAARSCWPIRGFETCDTLSDDSLLRLAAGSNAVFTLKNALNTLIIGAIRPNEDEKLLMN